MENPIRMDDLGVITLILGNLCIGKHVKLLMEHMNGDTSMLMDTSKCGKQ